MTAQILIDILDRNNQHREILIRPNGSVRKIVHLENSFNHICLRFWYFDDNDELESTACESAPHGEMDLLACYADDVDCFGIDGLMQYTVAWY